MNKHLLKALPKVDGLLKDAEINELVAVYGRELVKEATQQVIEEQRRHILAQEVTVMPEKAVYYQAVAALCHKKKQPILQPVVNGTGVVLHTNLGRAILSQEIKAEFTEVAFSYSNLEYNLTEGDRGSRYDHLTADLLALTGAEAALVVNNNAAAVLLALQTVAKGKEIIISRGELVEIGGSFRIPDIIALSGGLIREVGTTNKTHLSDYEQAINENTGAILKVHTSNYKVVGFTESVSLEALVKLGRSHQLPVMNDLGSGLLIDLTKLGFPHEATVKECVNAGCDLVTFSGDKLLGGPQAGIIVGKACYINEMKKNQLTRVLRVGKLTLSALELTLKEYLTPETVMEKIPTLRLLNLKSEALEKKAVDLQARLMKVGPQLQTEIEEGLSQVGGGSYPGEVLPTKLLSCVVEGFSPDQLEKRLRENQVPIIVRVKDQGIQLDMRTVLDKDFDIIVAALALIVKEGSSSTSD